MHLGSLAHQTPAQMTTDEPATAGHEHTPVQPSGRLRAIRSRQGLDNTLPADVRVSLAASDHGEMDEMVDAYRVRAASPIGVTNVSP
jgi:hypothetical protein